MTSSTFADNLSLPIHRWFRFSAGFSAPWVKETILKEMKAGRTNVLDPFAGSGTVVVESQLCGVNGIGIEAHPFISRVGKAKLNFIHSPVGFKQTAFQVLENAKKITPDISEYTSLIRRCYPDETLLRLDQLKRAWKTIDNGSPASELSWLALASILRECSPVGTAQWQYVLPKKIKSRPKDPFVAYQLKVELMAQEMSETQKNALKRNTIIAINRDDARTCSSVQDKWADLIITSPPYANNYDYADATRLEMTFFGDIDGWANLHDSVRRHLMHSCTQHVSDLVPKTFDMINDPILAPIRDEIFDVCKTLEKERLKHGGKKNYHTMIAAYFYDMAQVWSSLRRVTKKDSRLCFVIGDSAPYGVYAPVDKWIGEIALNSGFSEYSFVKLRDRNIKWKNRKHTVPLKEGQLWVEG